MKKRSYTLTEVAVGLFVFVIVALIGYGCWRINRWWNYHYSYKSFVTQQIELRVAPLEKRIKALEERQ